MIRLSMEQFEDFDYFCRWNVNGVEVLLLTTFLFGKFFDVLFPEAVSEYIYFVFNVHVVSIFSWYIYPFSCKSKNYVSFSCKGRHLKQTNHILKSVFFFGQVIFKKLKNIYVGVLPVA